MQLLTESAGIDFFGQRKRKHFSILCSEGIKSQSPAGGTFLNSTYGFDVARGNLTYRKDNRRNKQENFTYDNLNRLKTYGGIVMDYDPKGNITKKGDVGTFHYQTPDKPYALSGADIGTNKVIPPREQTIRYTSFDRPAVITENDYEASFIYNASGDRQKMTVKKGGKPLYTRYYLGGRYETDVMGNSQKHRLYIGGDAYTAPAVYMNTGNGWALYYICRDYLGNMTHLVNGNGTVVQELSYDAWGRLRNPETHAVYLPDNETELMLGRGYTGHEHLPMFGLINMNARLYDPVLGRFLSPDPYVQMPDFSQNFNRYSYCLNNPLVYVDQDGKVVWFIIGGALIGAYVGASIKGQSFNPAKWEGNWWQGALWGAGVGAISGAGIGAVWAAGGTISIGLHAYGLKPITLVAFSKATASTGGILTASIGGTTAATSIATFTIGKKKERKDITPVDVGVEWLTGTGPRERTFYEGDTFTEMLKKHDHINNTKQLLADRLKNGLDPGIRNDYSLSGIEGVPKYVNDYSTLATAGNTGNLAVTYLGSYQLYYDVLSINKNSANVRFRVENTSSIASGTRPPVLGYTPFWQNNVAPMLNNAFSSGPMSPTKQTFIWNEIIRW